MNWTNYHTHSHYCDGQGTISEYIEFAVNKGMYALGFSGHSPLPFPSTWNMKYTDLDKYLSELKTLKKKYEDKIKIFIGLEVDYIPDISGPAMFQHLNLDYTIGSVHWLKKNDDQHWDFDDNTKSFKKGLNEIFNGNIKELVNYYYSLIIDMVQNDPPDVIGHFDLINKFNQTEAKNLFFCEDDKWYKDIVYDTLEVVRQSNCIVEVNTRGYMKKLANFFYPNTWIIKLCKDMNIPITMSADAHKPQEVTSIYKKLATFLLQQGYNEIRILDENGWHPVELTINGLAYPPIRH